MSNDQVIDVLFSVKHLCNVLINNAVCTPEIIPLILRLENDADRILDSAMAELESAP